MAGDYWGLDHDEFVRVPSKIATVVDLLDAKGISWAGYFEGNPSPGYMGDYSMTDDGTWDYVRKHKLVFVLGGVLHNQFKCSTNTR